MSGDQRQRVVMGRALVRNPALFLFDEPLSNLDAKLWVEMRMEIKRLHQRLGTTMVYVTHDQVEAMTLATRIAVMHQGRIQHFADPQTIYDRPANLFVARCMGSPSMNTFAARLHVTDGELSAVAGTAAGLALRLGRPVGDLQAWIGRDVMLGIRPECITQPDAIRPGGFSQPIDTRIEMIEPTGAETMALIRFGEHELMARLGSDARPAVGSTARLSVNMSKVCLFDPASEERIA